MGGRGERQGSCVVPQRATAVDEVGLKLQLALCVICVTSGNLLEVKVTRVLAWCLPTPWPSHRFTLIATVRCYNCLILESRKPRGEKTKQNKLKKKPIDLQSQSLFHGRAKVCAQVGGRACYDHLSALRLPSFPASETTQGSCCGKGVDK